MGAIPDYQPGDNFEYRISEGAQGVKETMQLMRQLVRQGRASPAIIQAARDITGNLSPKDWGGQINALYNFVRDRIRYTMDPNEVELLTSPEMLLQIGQGDCDDKSTLLASLLEALGHPARFHAIGFFPQQLEHVYVETRYGPGWFPLDSTEPLPAGQVAWNHADVRERYIVNI